MPGKVFWEGIEPEEQRRNNSRKGEQRAGNRELRAAS
jgi:GTP-dependent phosphoenolpyruvate carboxykinase